MRRKLTHEEAFDIAGILRYAREHYAQEAAAIYLAPRDGQRPSCVEQRMIDDRLNYVALCDKFAKEFAT